MVPPDYPLDPEQARESSARLLRDDTRFAMGRIAIFQYVAVAVFVFLIAGFWVLQVRDHEVNSELAERNRVKIVPLPAPRGKILDRDGRVVVDNQPSFTLMLSQENLKPEHLEAIAAGVYAAGFADRYRSANCGWVALRDEMLLVDLPRGVSVEFLGFLIDAGGQIAGALVNCNQVRLVRLLEQLRALGIDPKE